MLDTSLLANQKKVSKALTGAQTATAVWTPASGKYIVLTAIEFTTSAAANVVLFCDTNDIATTGLNVIKAGDFADKSGIDCVLRHPLVFGVDKAIKVTTDAGNITVVLYGYEQ